MRPLPFTLPARWHRLAQVIAVVFILSILTYTLYPHYQNHYSKYSASYYHPPASYQDQAWHPVDDLHEMALNDQTALLGKRRDTLEEMEAAYIERRGRRPPPGFDKWYAYAQSHNAILVEDFWDRIYDDLEPFWGVSASEIRKMASKYFFRISVRDGKVHNRTDESPDRVPWLQLWSDQIAQISEFLPDLDLAINELDESRVIVPWETINKHVTKAGRGKKVVSKSRMVTSFSNTVVKDENKVRDIDWKMTGDAQYWDLAVRGCHPDSAARKAYIPIHDYTSPPPLEKAWPKLSSHGYVQNWTLARAVCDNPSLQELHGTFIEPLSISTTDKLIPIFGGSKLSVNNEILLPAAMYWTDDPAFTGGKGHGDPWSKKFDKLIWRGVASGGRHKEATWTRFQRHRFVGMVNGTNVRRAFTSGVRPPMFALPEEQPYELSSVHEGTFATWLERIADAGFVHHNCFPNYDGSPNCTYTDPWYKVVQSKPMAEQYRYKYLPDVDGNSFSGRYRGFLASSSLPIKATIYDEWHDSRLVPWAHFVPMDNTFVDLYGILEYFIGTKTKPGHDRVAQAIAMAGKDWAAKTLRKEDMVIYVFRLLLEYARLCDDKRDRLGWASAPAQ